MESPFPKPTLVVALCLATSSLLVHTAGLVALYHVHEGRQAIHIFQRRQTLYSAIVFCTVLTALLVAESSEIDASPKLPLAWYFLSVVFLEGDRRQLLAYNNPNTAKTSVTILSLMPLLLYIRPLPLFYAIAPERYYSLLTFVPTIVEFLVSCRENVPMQHVLHTYRCRIVVISMLAFLITSLVIAFREAGQSGLVSGLTLDVLVFLTHPICEPWSDLTWVWWVKKCSGVLQENIAGQTSHGGVGGESQEELQDSGAASLSRDVHSDTRNPSFEEHSIGM